MHKEFSSWGYSRTRLLSEGDERVEFPSNRLHASGICLALEAISSFIPEGSA